MQTAAVEFVPPPIMDTQAGRMARRSVIGRASRAGAGRGAYRCTACGGRCEVQVDYDDDGNVAHSRGKCRTPNCIAWED